MVQKENFTKNLRKQLMSKKINKKMVIRLMSLILFLLIIIGATIVVLPWVNDLKTSEGREALKLYIESKKTVGTFIFIGLQAFQVLLPIVPPIQIIGGALFGTFWGSIFSFVGLYLGMSIVYGLVRVVGYPLVEAFVGEKDLKKFNFLKDPDKVALVFFIIYLIPGMPKDTISFFAPLTDMNKKTYFLYVIPARFPLLFLSAIFGSAISDENYTLAVILSIIMIDIGIIGIIFRDKVINHFEKKVKFRKKLSDAKEIKHNRNIRKTGLILVVSSLILSLCDIIFMSTEYFISCKSEFLRYHNLKGVGQKIYFATNYGLYWFISIAVIGISAIIISLKKRKNHSPSIEL